jgi:Spy/CpxP family protein refolding chaperone
MNENAMLFSFREAYHIREIRRMKIDFEKQNHPGAKVCRGNSQYTCNLWPPDALYLNGLGAIQEGSCSKHQINQTTNKHMKTGTLLKCITVAAGLLCAVTFQAVAQPAGGGGPGGGGAGGGGRGGFRPVLTQEQMTQMRDAMQGSEEMAALTTKLAAAQKEAIDTALAKDAKDETVRAKVEAVAKIQTDIAMLRYTKGVKPIAASITDDQKTQIDAAPGMTYNQLLGGGGGFGGGRGGRGGGGAGGPGGGGAAPAN